MEGGSNCTLSKYRYIALHDVRPCVFGSVMHTVFMSPEAEGLDLQLIHLYTVIDVLCD